MAMANQLWMDAGFMLSHWEIRPRHGTLRRLDDGISEPIRVEPRVMAVLVCLAHHAGEVVTRDEFGADVWGGRIVTDEALSRCISVLRQVLGDDSREPRFIRTIARIGYTLLQTPIPLPGGGEGKESSALPADPATSLAPIHSPALERSAAPSALEPAAPSPSVPAPPTAVKTPSAPPGVGAWGADPRGAGSLGVWGVRLRRPAPVAIGAIALSIAGLFFFLSRSINPDAKAPPPPVRRLLVLPFDTTEASGFGRDVGVELADEISGSLASVERLQISGRTSADMLAAEHLSAVAAGRKLGVDAVLNGSVAERSGGLRVAVQLTATSDARVIWSQVYERQAADIFAVESSIASAVVRELVGLLNREGIAGIPSVEPQSRDLESYQLYLRGVHQVRLRGEDSLRLAVDLFSAALRRDPSYARAEVGLASAYALLPSYSYEDPAEMYALAEKSLASADELSHTRTLSAGTRAYLGFMRGQWTESETAFRTAIVADPNNPDVRQMYSQLLGAVGRFDAALTQAHLALDIDPLAPVVVDRLGILYLWRGRDAEAASNAAVARELGLDEVVNPETKILLKLHLHEDAEASDELRRLQHSLRRSDAWIDPCIEAYRHPDKRPAAIAMLDRIWDEGGVTARVYFGVMVLLESPARALRGFAALPSRGGNDLEFLFSVDAAAVRRDPAFGEFIRKLGIEAYWDRFGWSPACRRDGARIVCQ
ncbi:MAG TPA: winged helix-turn-helix domain-containing protein [Steroidobacteraceae bacterium]|nr:winged helix-turn-helix domain-containing protein [Steroidobacteraceae bacterium]